MRLMLIGGSCLLTAIVGGVILAFNSGEPVALVAPTAAAPDSAASPTAGSAEPLGRSMALLATEAEPIARKFLEAKFIDEILPLIRNPEVAADRLRLAHPDGVIPALGLSEFDLYSAIISGRFVSFPIRTRDFEPKMLVFIDEPDGLKIDWESSVGWSAMAWKEFLATQPVEPQVFRLILSPVDYYNFEFKDDLNWQSYQLESADKEHAVYGYVEKGSVLDERLRLDPGTTSKALMLSLRFPQDAKSSNQVVIEDWVADNWIQQDP